jgi:hypothetical protein
LSVLDFLASESRGAECRLRHGSRAIALVGLGEAQGKGKL